MLGSCLISRSDVVILLAFGAQMLGVLLQRLIYLIDRPVGPAVEVEGKQEEGCLRLPGLLRDRILVAIEAQLARQFGVCFSSRLRMGKELYGSTIAEEERAAIDPVKCLWNA